MKPIEIEFLMKDELTEGVRDAQKETSLLANAAEKANKKIAEKIKQQQNVIKATSEELKRLKKEYASMTPGRGCEQMALKIDKVRESLATQKTTLVSLEKEQDRVRSSARWLSDEYVRLDKSTLALEKSNHRVSLSWQKVLGVIGGGAVLQHLGKDIIKVRGEMEMMGKSFEVLLKDKEKANKMVNELRSYALYTPLTIGVLSKATQTLLGFNVEAERVLPILQQIGDISMGDNVRFASLILAFSQMSAAGRLLGQDLNQMINAGFNPLQVISEKTGKSIAELKKSMESGAISSQMVADAFEAATAEGGKFHGMLANSAGGIKNLKNQFVGALEEMQNKIGESSEELIKGAYKAGISLTENYEKVGRILAAAVVTLGTYKTALMLVELWEKRAALAKLLSTKRQLLLNAAMNANPYVLLATAIVGLVTAIWSLSDSSTAAQKAQERFNKKQEEAKRLAAEHRDKIVSLIESSRDLALTDLQRGESLAELRKEYPKIFAQYDIESIKLADILELKRKINAEDQHRLEKKESQDLKSLEKEIAYYKALGKAAGKGGSGYLKKAKDLEADRDILLQEKGKDISEQFIASLNHIDVKDFDKYIKVLEKKISGKGNDAKIKMKLPIDVKGTLSDEAIYDTADVKNFIQTLKERKQNKIDEKSKKTNYKQDLEKAKKNWEEAKKVLQEIEADKSAFSTKQYEAAKKEVEKTESIYKNLGGITEVTQQSTKTGKIKPQEIQSQAQEKRNLEFQASQARIDAMKEGHEKIIAQIELNHKKELQILEWNKEDYLKRKVAIEKSIFESDEKNQGKKFDASAVSLNAGEIGMFETLKEGADKKHSNELSSVYVDLLTKYQGYTEKRLEIQKKFQTDRENLIKAGASQNTLRENKYQEKNALEAIDNEFAMREDSFQSWADNIVNISLEQLQKLLVAAEKELKRMEFLTPNDPKLAAQRTKVTALNKAVNKAEPKTTPDKRSVKEWGNLYKVLDKVNKQFEEIGDTIGGTVGDIIKSAGGIASATLQMVDGITTLTNSSAQAMGSTSKAAEKSITSVEKASVVLAIIGAALQVATKIADLLGGDDREKYEKAKENYESYVKVLDKIIDKQKELIETMTGEEAVKASERAIELTKKQMEATRALASEWLSSKSGSYFSGGNWRGADKVLKKYRKELKTLGYDISSVQNQLIKLSSEELRKIREELPKMWADFGNELSEHLDTIIDLGDKVEEIGLKLQEGLTQVSFDDIYSNFLDMLMNMDSSNEDLADNFEKYMQKAILNSMLLDNYKEKIKDWYTAFAKANEDKRITKSEYDKLQEDWSSMVTDALKKRDALKEFFNWQDEGVKQSASSGAFTAMTQEQGGKLEGLFTSGQIHWHNIDVGLAAVNTQLNSLLGNSNKIVQHTAFIEKIFNTIMMATRDGIKIK